MKKSIKKLVHIIKSFKYFTPSYSQEGEDILLFKLLGNKNNGMFVDVGAHHPFRFSNTYFLYTKGWQGINIDAMPGSMGLFNKYRKRDINLEIGVSLNEEVLNYYIFNEPALNTFLPEYATIYQNKGYKLTKIIKLETHKLESILDKYLSPTNKIDILFIDVEGKDFEVLQSNNWKKYNPTFIVIESHNSNITNILESKIYIYLNGLNYNLKSKLDYSLIFEYNIRANI